MRKLVWSSALMSLVLVGCGGEGGCPAELAAPRQEALESAPQLDLAAFTETSSGLQMMDLEVGDGAEAESGQTVTVHYTGWFLEGDKFDSSVDRGESFSFPLGQGNVIAGWDQGVAGMKVGGWRRLVIPPDLAYGAAGRSGIPPNSTLVFDVELYCVE